MPSKKPEKTEVTTDTLVIDKDATPLLADDDDDAFWDGGERCGDGYEDDDDDLQQVGADFSSALGLPFEFKVVEFE